MKSFPGPSLRLIHPLGYPNALQRFLSPRSLSSPTTRIPMNQKKGLQGSLHQLKACQKNGTNMIPARERHTTRNEICLARDKARYDGVFAHPAFPQAASRKIYGRCTFVQFWASPSLRLGSPSEFKLLLNRSGKGKLPNQGQPLADSSNGQNGCEYELRSAFFAASTHQLHLTENELTKATRKSGWCGFCSSCEASSRTMLSLSRNRMQGMDGRLIAPLSTEPNASPEAEQPLFNFSNIQRRFTTTSYTQFSQPRKLSYSESHAFASVQHCHLGTLLLQSPAAATTADIADLTTTTTNHTCIRRTPEPWSCLLCRMKASESFLKAKERESPEYICRAGFCLCDANLLAFTKFGLASKHLIYSYSPPKRPKLHVRTSGYFVHIVPNIFGQGSYWPDSSIAELTEHNNKLATVRNAVEASQSTLLETPQEPV
ncbi:hypothetical protein CCUS01_14793 [Colletotrichum cuscutae]|uniref:Uncharacterized protein n=1 Tax=Colletotrichum cuscutae TaxID=1209917 RepID=A0AAI9VFT2_9PEZI|nr:hypothetical protein CCUS01_14793 [Colletotrichum cuscutae]